MTTLDSQNVSVDLKLQYSKWPYPQPIDDIAAWQARGGVMRCDPCLDHAIMWPERDYNPEMSILIAGCGTNEAALQAYNHPHAKVVGIDLSMVSLGHQNHLKKKHNLTNLTLHHMDLHDASTLGRQFDLIVSYGVVHHQSNPPSAVAALAHVLKADGVLLLSLYGVYLRSGVYMIQNALRRMSLTQSSDDVQVAKVLVNTALPPWHPIKAYMATVADLQFDAGFVDSFLHVQDHAFAVPDIFALVDRCDLQFQGWFDNLSYFPEGAFYGHPSIYQRLAALPLRERWATVELLAPPISGHRFLLRHKGSEGGQLDMSAAGLLELIPARRHGLNVLPLADGALRLSREWHTMMIAGGCRSLFEAVDGVRTISAIATGCGIARGDASVQVLDFFRHSWRLGHLTLSKRPLFSP